MSAFENSNTGSPGGQTVLLVEDSMAQAEVFKNYLINEPYSVEHATSGEAALEFLARSTPAVMLLDLGLPGIQGMELLKLFQENKVPEWLRARIPLIFQGDRLVAIPGIPAWKVPPVTSKAHGAKAGESGWMITFDIEDRL